MQFHRNRKYPIQYKKINDETDEMTIDLSLTAAAGMLAVIFAGGVLSGWMIKRMFD